MVNRSEIIKEDKKKKSYKKDKSILPAEHEVEQKLNAVKYYEGLSDAEKLEFKEEIKKKKLREDYGSYVQYVFGDTYKMTNFHRKLCGIIQSCVKRAENGEQVRLLLSTPPQVGKLLSNDTLVLTKNGWKKHGDLVVGDYVINQYGEYVRVKNVFPKHFANKRITFTNGEQIECHENHEWLVYDRFLHSWKIKETKKIEERYEENHLIGRGHRYRYQLPIKDFLIGNEKDLKVNPYVLGVWLGDGKRDCGTICACPNDIITLNECRKFYPNGFNIVHKTTDFVYQKFNGLTTDLHTYNLCSKKSGNKKFIPEEYLTASVRQRLELLAGLIDTDGTVDKKHNRIGFTTSDIELRDSFCSLVSTFGWRATIVEHKPMLSSSGIQGKKPYWDVCFNPTTFIPCRIERKQLTTFSKQRKISICKIEDIEPIEGNCIEVDGGIYLVGKTLLPTHNSMTLTETLPSWFIGRNPDLSVILTAYNADIAEKFGDRNRQKIKDFGKDIFGVKISESQDNKTLFQIKGHQGQVFSTGILGGLTSNPAALCIVDDPFKNGEEAGNQSIRDSVFRVYQDSIETRLRKLGCLLIIIHTRWHEDDLIGRLAKESGYIYVNFPAVWEKGEDRILHRKVGETLCPELGMSAEWAERQMRISGSRVWNALYQGKPFIDGGNIIKRENIKFYNKQSKPTQFDEITLSCDLSFGGVKKDNDPNCGVVWGRQGGNHYLLSRFNKKCGFQETIGLIKLLCAEYPTMRKKIIEAKANGKATIEMLSQQVSGVVGFDPKGASKEQRFRLVAPYFESGNVYLPDESIDKDIEEVVEQLLKFPNVAHDEYVDTTSQYLLDYSYKYDSGKILTDNYFTTISDAFRGIKI